MRSGPLAFFACLTACVMFTGCMGYERGSLAHPQLRTVAIGPVTNPTEVAGLSAQLRQFLAEEITRDGSLRLVSDPAAADCVLHSAVRTFKSQSIAETRVPSADKDQRFNRSTAFSVDVQVTWHLQQGRSDRQLLAPATATGRGVYNDQYDYTSARDEGLRQATHEAARQIVSSITEGW